MDDRSSPDSLAQMSEINMTPLIDLSFLLLITFIITFPFIEYGIRVDLPKGAATQLQGREKSRTVTMDVQGKVYLDEKQIGREALAAEMNAIGRANPDITIYVRADEGVRYGEVAGLLKVLLDAGITRTALVTQAGEEKKRR